MGWGAGIQASHPEGNQWRGGRFLRCVWGSCPREESGSLRGKRKERLEETFSVFGPQVESLPGTLYRASYELRKAPSSFFFLVLFSLSLPLIPFLELDARTHLFFSEREAGFPKPLSSLWPPELHPGWCLQLPAAFSPHLSQSLGLDILFALTARPPRLRTEMK